jgi:ABC-type transporter Mla subunit MlaD
LSAIGYRVLRAPDLSGVVSHIDTATGAWSAASKQQVQSVAAIERDLRAEMWHVDRTLTTVDGTLKTAQGTLAGATEAVGVASEQMRGVGPLLASAQRATDAIPPTLQAAQNTLGSIPPLVASGNGALTDFRAYMAQDQPALVATLGNVQRVTDSTAGIAADAQRVTDKVSKDYLKPVPWYMKPAKYFGDFWDITAAVARHTP